jgi:CPA2 family monovalent cation:H+ antiporter-2
VHVVVVDEDHALVRELQRDGLEALVGDVGQPVVLERAGVRRSRLLVICVTDRLAARRALDAAKGLHPAITVLARTHTLADRDVLEDRGAIEAVVGEVELALELSRRALMRFDVGREQIDAAIDAARRR